MNSILLKCRNNGILIFYFLSLLFLNCNKSYCQKFNDNCWETKAIYNDINFKDNYYKITIENDSLHLSINKIYNYKFKLYKKDKIKYFSIGSDKMVLEERNVNNILFLHIKYYNTKIRESVNEITTVKFVKCSF
jgi:hypothetical protein